MQTLHSDPAYWAQRLNTTYSPLFTRSVAVAIGFFRGAMPDMSDASLESHLRPIDWSWPECHVVDLRHGERVYAYRYDALATVGMYFTRSGYAARDLGIDPAGRSRATYVMTSPSKALWCRTKSIITTWDPRQPCFMAIGGAMQLIVLHARKKMHLALAIEPGR